MAEYSSLKVPELKKLLAEKGLPQTGNKADLIARLQENDKEAETEEKPAPKEDEIDYSDDEEALAPVPAAVPAAPAPVAEPVAEPVVEAPVAEAAPVEGAEPEDKAAEEKPVEEEKPAEPEVSYAMGLSSTAADEEAKKRADRAKRFGLEEDADAIKRADRAKRFGLDEKELASSLDAALPERPLKRGRGRDEAEGEGNRPEKRQSLDRRSKDTRRGGRGGRDGRDRRGGRGNDPARDGGAKKAGIFDDPTEKAKAEKRAARFAAN